MVHGEVVGLKNGKVMLMLLYDWLHFTVS